MQIKGEHTHPYTDVEIRDVLTIISEELVDTLQGKTSQDFVLKIHLQV